jgi:putative addiction module killer protein
MMEAIPRDIQRYVTSGGDIPFEDWFLSLRSLKTQAKVDARLQRVALGNLGDVRFVGEGVYELKIDYGPGYRIYFAQVDAIVVLLLCGGDKGSQNQDITIAKHYWKEYQERP